MPKRTRIESRYEMSRKVDQIFEKLSHNVGGNLIMLCGMRSENEKLQVIFYEMRR